MAKIDVEKKEQDNPERNANRGNTKWYLIAFIVIIAIIVAWIAMSDDSRANVEIPPEPVVLKDRTGTRNMM